MKHSFLTLTIFLFAIFSGCKDADSKIQVENSNITTRVKSVFPVAKKLTDFKNTEFLPTLQNKITKGKNAIYCVTLLYAWDEIKKIINTPLQIDNKFHDLSLLNNSKFHAGALKEGEYYASGEIDDNLIKAKAEFSKSLPFEIKLTSFNDRLKFNKTNVASFGNLGKDFEHDFLHHEQISKIISILYYQNDNNFIIKLSPKDTCHEIILFKSEEKFTTMDEIILKIQEKLEIGLDERKNEKLYWKYYLTDDDDVVIPKFKFNIETNYNTLEQNIFQSNSKIFQIENVWQRTAFSLDESGAIIESEVAIAAAMEEEKPKPKKMIFDKPFFLMLKRVENKNPYFCMWTNDTELMTKE